MARYKFVFLVTILLSTRLTTSEAQQSVLADEKVREYLKKYRSEYIQSILEKKPQKVQSYFSDSIRLMPEFQKTIIGKSNVMTYHNTFASRFDVRSYTANETEVLDLERRIVEEGIFTIHMILKSTGKEHEVKGKYLALWERSATGKLLLITEAWNYNHYLEVEQQLRFEEMPAAHVALQAHLPVNNNISFELAAFNTLMESAICRHDAKIWSQFYTSDAIFLYSRHPAYKGRDALNSFIEQHVKELPVFEKLDLRNDRIDDLGTFIVEYASHIAIWRGGEYSGVVTGKDLRIWRREKGGTLKLFRHIAMYD